MARTAINKVALGLKSWLKATPTTLDSTNDMEVAFTRDALTLVAANSSSADSITVTVKAKTGFNDVVATIPKGETWVGSNFESAYFGQDGVLVVEPSADTGTIFAVEDLV